MWLPRWLTGKRICRQCRRPRFKPWVMKIPWRRKWLPTPVFLPGESPEQRSLVGYSPWGHKKLDTIEQLSMHMQHMRSSEMLWHYSQGETLTQRINRTIKQQIRT